MEQLQLAVTTSPISVRKKELEAGRIVLRAMTGGHPFLVRRAHAAVAALDSGPARRPLLRTIECVAETPDDVAGAVLALLGYGSVLERHGEYREAEQVYRAVLPLRPDDSRIPLHAARAARKAGDRAAALALYRLAGERAGGDSHMQLLVQVGQALIADEPEHALTSVVAAARTAGNREVEAVAREERARLRQGTRRGGAALRDLVAASGRFRDSHDRIRVLHRAAELLTARGDLLAAREALLTALDLASETQRGHTVQRLRTVARAMGDDVALRRTRGQGTTTLVTLAPPRARRAGAPSRTARHLRRVRDSVTRPGRTSCADRRQ
jgi:tetratricopeptide (TPR) repeat protein